MSKQHLNDVAVILRERGITATISNSNHHQVNVYSPHGNLVVPFNMFKELVPIDMSDETIINMVAANIAYVSNNVMLKSVNISTDHPSAQSPYLEPKKVVTYIYADLTS